MNSLFLLPFGPITSTSPALLPVRNHLFEDLCIVLAENLLIEMFEEFGGTVYDMAK
jgi:hypothetical protein